MRFGYVRKGRLWKSWIFLYIIVSLKILTLSQDASSLVLDICWDDPDNLPTSFQLPTVQFENGRGVDLTSAGHAGIDLDLGVRPDAPKLNQAITVEVVFRLPFLPSGKRPLVSRWQWKGIKNGRSFELGISTGGRPYFIVSETGLYDESCREVYAEHVLKPNVPYIVTGVFEPTGKLAVYINGYLSGCVIDSIPSKLANPDVPIKLCARPGDIPTLAAVVRRVTIWTEPLSDNIIWKRARAVGLDFNPGDRTVYFAEEVLRSQIQGNQHIQQITHPPGYHFFGYYDKRQFDPTGRYVLGMRVDFENRHPGPEDVAEIGMVDLQSSNQWIHLGETRAWCWQQGCMLEWVPNHTNLVIWNDREGDRFVARLFNVETKETKTLPMAVYAISPDGKTAFCINMARIGDIWPSYAYVGVPDPEADILAPADSGIWKMDLETEETELLVSIAEVADLPSPGYSKEGKKHYLFNIQCSPDGKRILFIHWAGYDSRLCTIGVDGSGLRVVAPHGGHYYWYGSNQIICYGKGGYWLYPDDGSLEGTLLWSASYGHEHVLPYRDWILADTYRIGPHGEQYLYLFHVPTVRFVPVAALPVPSNYQGDFRVDFHPRISPDGRYACIDSAHTGQGRQMYLVDLKPFLKVPDPGTFVISIDKDFVGKVHTEGSMKIQMKGSVRLTKLEVTLRGNLGWMKDISVEPLTPLIESIQWERNGTNELRLQMKVIPEQWLSGKLDLASIHFQIENPGSEQFQDSITLESTGMPLASKEVGFTEVQGTPSIAEIQIIGGSSLIQEQLIYPSSISYNDSGDPLRLVAEVIYEKNQKHSPLAVVLHGYISGIEAVESSGRRLAQKGFFVLLPAMRGRDGSEGVRDSGGLEIYDIVDAVRFCLNHYKDYIDPDRWYITGYSGGGANALAVLTRFPDLFACGAVFFPMTDYGCDPVTGWFYEKGSEPFREVLLKDIGDPSTGDPAVLDRYLARAVRFGAGNNPYAEIHFFVNRDEPICPLSHCLAYVGEAIRQASSSEEFTNLYLHIGDPNTYVDFNQNGKCDPDELQYWPHGYLTKAQQAAAEKHFLDRLLAGEIPAPILKEEGRLFIGGWVETKRFSCWLGDGQNAAGWLNYKMNASGARFELKIISSDPSVRGCLKVSTKPWLRKKIVVYLNGKQIEQFVAEGGVWKYEKFSDGDQIWLIPQTALPKVHLTLVHDKIKLSIQGPSNTETILYSSSDLTRWIPEQRILLDENGKASFLLPRKNLKTQFYRVQIQ